jgi:competence protein ComEC
VPAQRTVAMLGVVALLQNSGLRWPWPMVLLAAAVLVTALDPWALLQPGFWLSFAAVGLLMASDPAQRQPPPAATPAGPWARAWRHGGKSLWQGLRGQWVATLGLAPLGLVIFQQLSLVGLLANLVAIPLVTLLVTPLALLGILWAGLWAPAAWLVQGLVGWLGWLAGFPLAVWEVAVAPVWAQGLGLLAAVVAILPWPWRLRLLALPLALPMLLPQRELPAPGRFELLALDVGQGSAVLVRTRGHLLLFDAGPQYARDSDAGQRILLPLLRSLGERRIDRLVLSHRDQDHVGGARSVLAALPVGELLGSLEPHHPLHALGVPNRRCLAGERWTWDGVHFALLHPPAADFARALKPNAMSCVLKVEGSAPGSGAVLLTGDIEREQELALVAGQPDALRAQVLVAPHHGSRTSSTAAFIAAVAPQAAVFQAGYRNRFGHPAPEVMARYLAQGVTAIETTTCGAWRWLGDAAVAEAVCERERVRRHWHDQPAPAASGSPR